jgi:Kef-type K+ transport system membrane component KefB
MIFFLQMFVILALCRACGWAVRRFMHQPQVIGEMIAGVILGPSLLGQVSRPGCSCFSFHPRPFPC